MQDTIIIIGGGQAGAQVAQSLRQAGHEGAIRLIGEESYPPYQRPPLSKKFLAGEIGPDSLWIRPPAFYGTQNIDFIPDSRVVSVDTKANRVELANGNTISFDRLVLATGTSARSLPVDGADLDGVVSLRSITDVDAIRTRLQAASSLVIVGAGYIGLEVAAVARMMGKSVTVIEAQDRAMKRVVSPQISSFYEELHRSKGVQLRFDTPLEGFEGDGSVTGVRIGGGDVLAADLVLVAVGAAPNEGLATDCGIETDNGIIVDGGGQTSIETVYAAGDCTRFYSSRYGRSVRMESVQNAIDQAKAVAQAMTGEDIDYDPLPWFWSDQYDVKLQIAGLSDGYDDTVMVGDPGKQKFYVAYLRKGQLIAVDSINSPRSHMMARRAIGEEWRDGLLPPEA